MENFGEVSEIDRRTDYLERRKKFKNKKEEESEGISRRTFVKGLASTSVFALTGFAGKYLVNCFKSVSVDDSGEKVKNEEKSEEATQSQIEIAEDDARIIGKTVEAQLRAEGKVVIDKETKRAIQARWKKSYSKKPKDCSESDNESGKNHLGLLETMEKMQSWISGMKAEFKKEGLPEEEGFVYLTIPESHFQFDAFSKAEAKGPYQFKAETARALGLVIDDKIDERCDPIKSARACAQYLKENYERLNNDWSLALARYNGGYPKKHRLSKENKADLNYEDYLKWREDRINNFILEKNLEYKVKSGENLTVISKNYKISIEDILKENGLKTDDIQADQILKIPKSLETQISELGSSLENLNYPEKFYAILEVIKEEQLEKKFSAKPLQYFLEEVPKDEIASLSYSVKKGDELLSIARRFKKELKNKKRGFNLSVFSLLDLVRKQNRIKKDKIVLGQKIGLKVAIEIKSSLSAVAKNNNFKLSTLEKLNPAVINSHQALDSGAKIRIPKS